MLNRNVFFDSTASRSSGFSQSELDNVNLRGMFPLDFRARSSESGKLKDVLRDGIATKMSYSEALNGKISKEDFDQFTKNLGDYSSGETFMQLKAYLDHLFSAKQTIRITYGPGQVVEMALGDYYQMQFKKLVNDLVKSQDPIKQFAGLGMISDLLLMTKYEHWMLYKRSVADRNTVGTVLSIFTRERGLSNPDMLSGISVTKSLRDRISARGRMSGIDFTEPRKDQLFVDMIDKMYGKNDFKLNMLAYLQDLDQLVVDVKAGKYDWRFGGNRLFNVQTGETIRSYYKKFMKTYDLDQSVLDEFILYVRSLLLAQNLSKLGGDYNNPRHLTSLIIASLGYARLLS